MIFGDSDFAMAAARRVRRVHDCIHGAIDEDVGRFARGHHYRAHDAEALYWVHAPRQQMAIQVFEIAHGPLSPAERDEYVRDVARFAWMFGIPDEVIPTDWASFQAAMERVTNSDTIAVWLPRPRDSTVPLAPPSLVFGPAVRAYRSITAGLLPPRPPARLLASPAAPDRPACAASVAAVRASYRRLPLRLRVVPDYIEATRRIQGKPGPDRAGRALQEALLRHLRPPA